VTNDIPIVAGRDAVLRIAVAPANGFASRVIRARVLLYDAETGQLVDGFMEDQPIETSSDLGDLESTINIAMLGSAFRGDRTYHYTVELLEANTGAGYAGITRMAHWPPMTLPEWPILSPMDTGVMRVHLLPVEYEGSLPDISEERLAVYREYLYDQYPVTDVVIELGDTYQPAPEINLNHGYGWSQLLSALGEVRPQRGIADDQYIYGIFAAGYSSGLYGLCNLAHSAQDSYGRACIGLDSGPYSSADTLIHEIGHAHGRQHSPCGGAASPEPDYPHDNAIIGVQGYDMTSSTLIHRESFDYMSYCGPTWVSDFTWSATATRIGDINSLYELDSSRYRARSLQPSVTRYQTLWMYPDGQIEWQSVRSIPDGSALRQEWVPTRTVELLDEQDNVLTRTEAWFTPLDHLAGGTLKIPAKDIPALAVSARVID